MHLILLCIVPFSITIFKALDSNKSTKIIFFFMSGKYWTLVRKRIVASCNFNFVRGDKTTFQLFKSVNDKPFPMGTNMIGTSKKFTIHSSETNDESIKSNSKYYATFALD